MTQDPSNAHTARYVYTLELRASRRTGKSTDAAQPRRLGVDPTPTIPSTGHNAPLLAVVTAADIEKARHDRSCGCAVQVALSRIFSRTALVSYDSAWREDGSRMLSARATVERRSWVLPQHVVVFMRDFDQGANVRPITFEIPREDD